MVEPLLDMPGRCTATSRVPGGPPEAQRLVSGFGAWRGPWSASARAVQGLTFGRAQATAAPARSPPGAGARIAAPSSAESSGLKTCAT